MEIHLGSGLLVLSLLLIIAIFASKTSGRLGVPALLLFLTIGIIAGSDVLGIVSFNDYNLSKQLGIISLTIILFSGAWIPAIKVSRQFFGEDYHYPPSEFLQQH